MLQHNEHSRRRRDASPTVHPAAAETFDTTVFCITPDVHDEILRTIGARPPETGGKGFAPAGKFGIDRFWFDKRGSARSSTGHYEPHVEDGDAICEYWRNQPDEEFRLWTCDLHSHPGGLDGPSVDIGTRHAAYPRGDLVYAAEIFAQNPEKQHHGLPIVTYPGDPRRVTITPWIVCRDDPFRPTRAELRVCSVEEFPESVFNPDWERTVAAVDEALVLPPVELARLSNVLGPAFTIDTIRVEVRGAAATFVLVLPAGFPERAPTLLVRVGPKGRPARVPFSWRTLVDADRRDPMDRLADLLRAADGWAARSF